MSRVADGVACRRVLEAHGRGDVACEHLFHFLALVRVHLDETPYALLLVLGGVIYVGSRRSWCRNIP